MNPQVSIIIPMYNVSAYVGECLRSVLRQTDGDFEVIAVDDGSTDDTLEVARAAVAGDGRFRFFQQENQGQSAARNFAIGKAHGAYLLFLDADDYYRDDALEVLKTAVEADDLDYLDFTAKTFYETGDLKRTRKDDYDDRPEIPGVFTGQQLFVEYQKRRAYYCSPCMHYFKRSLLAEPDLRFDVGHIHEDELFSPLLIARATRAAYLGEALYFRRVRGDSSMTQRFGMHNVHGAFASTQKMEAWLREHADELEPAFVDAMAQRVYEVREIMTMYVNAVSAAELDEYARGLDVQDRISFQMIRCWSRYIDELYNSHTFKVGSALMAGPSWLKRHLK